MRKIIVALSIIVMIAACKNKKEEVSKETKKQSDVATDIFPKKKVDIKTVGILLYDGYTTLDAMGPYQVLSEIMGVNVFL